MTRRKAVGRIAACRVALKVRDRTAHALARSDAIPRDARGCDVYLVPTSALRWLPEATADAVIAAAVRQATHVPWRGRSGAD